MNMLDFKVHVLCTTYNQSSYIEETMNGFVMQQTNFQFVCTIIDDASTDGEPEVIRRYLKENFDLDNKTITHYEETEDYFFCYSRHKTNRNCFFAVFFLKYNHYSIKKDKLIYISEWSDKVKYQALCEGDDYWIASNKLQKQYDLLEKDDSIVFCHHNFYIQIGKNKELRSGSIPERQNLLSIARYNSTQTLTMFYRNIKPLIPEELKDRSVYTQFFPVRLAEYGDIYYIDEPMAVYRFNEGGIYGMQNVYRKFEMALYNIDNMMLWYIKRNRTDVVRVLKKRARNVCYGYILQFACRFYIKPMASTIVRFFKYI